MLGWWTDESKGYHLEDLEIPGKLISSRNVDFIEDSSPNDLAIINNISLSPESINKLVNDAISTDSTTVMNHNMRTFLFYFYFSIFRMDLHNQGSHMRGHMTCYIEVT